LLFCIGIENISVFSNLLNISQVLLDAIVDCKVGIHFSIYGSTPEIHDIITQIPGSFTKLISSIERVQNARVPLRAHVVRMKENEDDIENIRAFLRTIHIDSVHFDEIRKVFGGTQSKHLPSTPRNRFTHPNFRTDRKTFEANAMINTCWYGKLVVSTDGSIYPCEFERNITYGNVRNGSISQFMKADSLMRCWYFSFDQIDPCKRCEYRFACRDCRPMAFAECGCITDKNPRCCYKPLVGVWEA